MEQTKRSLCESAKYLSHTLTVVRQSAATQIITLFTTENVETLLPYFLRSGGDDGIVLTDDDTTEWIVHQLVKRDLILPDALGDILLSIITNDPNDPISQTVVDLLFKFHSTNGKLSEITFFI